MVQYGLIGIIILIGFVANSLFKIKKYDGEVRLLGILFLCLWCPKLFFSDYMFKDIGIWCFLAYGLLKFNTQVLSRSFCKEGVKKL